MKTCQSYPPLSRHYRQLDSNSKVMYLGLWFWTFSSRWIGLWFWAEPLWRGVRSNFLTRIYRLPVTPQTPVTHRCDRSSHSIPHRFNGNLCLAFACHNFPWWHIFDILTSRITSAALSFTSLNALRITRFAMFSIFFFFYTYSFPVFSWELLTCSPLPNLFSLFFLLHFSFLLLVVHLFLLSLFLLFSSTMAPLIFARFGSRGSYSWRHKESP